MSWDDYKPYVPVAARQTKAKKAMQKLQKKGETILPVELNGRIIARSFWGKAWCDHLETFSDYENRLPRGRRYVRNGSVCHLEIETGMIRAIVSGSELYHINIGIKKLPDKKWEVIKKQCSGNVSSLLELLQGKLSSSVMSIVTDKEDGLFPGATEIRLNCDCLDWSVLCKHLAAVLYGVGARLDESPELLFLLRGLDHSELIETGIDLSLTQGSGKSKRRLASSDLSGIFGIEMDNQMTKKEMNNPEKKRGTLGIGEIRRKPYPKTGAAVAKLRRKFSMTESELASLLGVSRQTIRNWEKHTGRLKLRQQSNDALRTAAQLDKQQAWRKLGN
ncbi:Helicase, SNF2/RAD54 family [hydrothermal vent metagenome]|uniref:Helicase, SNF2/RAD54 family n=1 Tax=hydrothermal vent metagenome TaxID=652676 RepID=A0A3B1D7Z1_9ZZZZ